MMDIKESRKVQDGTWIRVRFDNGAVKRFRSAHITTPLGEAKEYRWRAFSKAAAEAFRDGLYEAHKDDWRQHWDKEAEKEFVLSSYKTAADIRPDLFQ